MAEEFNGFFTTIAEKLAQQFTNSTPTQTEQTLHHPKLILQPVTFEDVKKMILSLSPSTAVREDCILPRILRAAIEPFAILITKIVN